MSFSRRILPVLVVGALAGCGFEPVHAPGGSASGLRGQLRADAPADRNDFDFVARIENRLGRGVGASYGLSYEIETDEEPVGVTPGQEITRYNIVGVAKYDVVELDTGQVVHSGRVESFASYSSTGSIVSTLTAGTDARSRLMIALADRVEAELVAAAPAWLAGAGSDTR